MAKDRYAVMGDPIAHSKSPRIHSRFAEQTAQHLEYRAIRVEPGRFAEAVAEFRDQGGRGLNVTVPFKQDAWVLADELGPQAERAGAVNTLLFRSDGSAYGDNTDGLGLVRDLTVNHGFPIRNKRVLLLGAGGATRGVLHPLLGCEPGEVLIANRTASKARELAMLFSDQGNLFGCGLDELAGHQPFDLIINATAAGLDDRIPELPEGILAREGWCYDLMYGDRPTAFVRWGQTHGAARSLDGLGMLVEQAAESFRIWRGIRPETREVIEALGEG